MSHHDRLEQVLGRLRKLGLSDDEVEAAMMPLNHIVAGYGPVESIRVARVDKPDEVTVYLATRARDFGPECSVQDDTATTKQFQLLLVGYHYNHGK